MEKPIYLLENWGYHVVMLGGFQGDEWCLGGNVYNCPHFNCGDRINVSTPVAIEGRIVTTYSGSRYKLGHCAGNEEEQMKYIMDDIERFNSYKEKQAICIGCQRPELHKICPAWGTPYYMSGELFTKELEEEWKERRDETIKNYKGCNLD